MATADRPWAIMVAQATPSTFMPQPLTNTMFRITFKTPATERMSKGVCVSPAARTMDAQKV